MSEPYKKVGRGGAGNFYSPKDIEDVSKAAESVFPPFTFQFSPSLQLHFRIQRINLMEYRMAFRSRGPISPSNRNRHGNPISPPRSARILTHWSRGRR